MASSDYSGTEKRLRELVQASAEHPVITSWLRGIDLETLGALGDVLAREELERIEALGYLDGRDAQTYAGAISRTVAGILWSYAGTESDDLLSILVNAVRNAYEAGVRDAATRSLDTGAQRAIAASIGQSERNGAELKRFHDELDEL